MPFPSNTTTTMPPATGKIPRTPIPYRIEHRIMNPSDSGLPIRHDTIYIISELRTNKSLVMKCPNKTCTGFLSVNLDPIKKPHWSLSEHMDWSVSVHPNVTHTCGAKFYISHSSVHFGEWD